MQKEKGFTLLEILLVVGIIAVLAGIVIIAINPSKQLASVRNAQRLSDLKQLNSAIIQFYIDKGYYPASTTLSTSTLAEICNTGSVSGTTTSVTGSPCGSLISLSELVPTYIVAIPVDPSGASSTMTLIPTAYAASQGTGYKIITNPFNKKIDFIASLAESGQVVSVGMSLYNSYQENADVVSPKTSFFQQVTYNKPAGALSSSRWLVKHGSFAPYYISFDSSPAINCWNASSTVIVLRMYSNTNNGASGAVSEPQCYDGSSWVSVGTQAYASYQWGENVTSNSTFTATDGDWNTFDAWSQYKGFWSNSATMINTVRWYEEAISWNIFI